MISNEKQYRTTKKLHKEFMEQLLKLQQNQSNDLLNEMHINALQAKVDDFEKEIAEYEALKKGVQKQTSTNDLKGIGEILIKARIANNWSQKQLAQLLGMEEQQIQRYEANQYQSASLPTLQTISKVLGINFFPIQATFNKPEYGTGGKNNAA